MELNSFLNTLWWTQNPVLPSPVAMRVALHLVWAIALGSGVMLLAGRLALRNRLGLAFLLMSWTLLPGAMSPAYWLGLAFQTPSLMSAVICLVWFLSRSRQESDSGGAIAKPQEAVLKILVAVGIVLGWVLLLDTLAWLPVSVYAWGFGSSAVVVLAVLSTLFWAVWGTSVANRAGPGRGGPALILCVLTLFVLTRLPTGNVWDALLDPWLWAALQVGWLISAVRRRVAARGSPPATRAGTTMSAGTRGWPD